MPSRCVAAGCSNTSSESVSVYKFPKQETLLKQWTKQVQRTRANWVPTASSTLCSEHFEADYMGMHVRYKKVLKPNAIPTIFKRSLVGTSETETPSTSTGSSQYKKGKSVTEKLAQKRVSPALETLNPMPSPGSTAPWNANPPPFFLPHVSLEISSGTWNLKSCKPKVRSLTLLQSPGAPSLFPHHSVLTSSPGDTLPVWRVTEGSTALSI
uniref:THAP-type domain-containing protein n=1 Tax=Oryzias latipes TaxID=8090 RepID=A0A3P9I1T3_ORYLA